MPLHGALVYKELGAPWLDSRLDVAGKVAAVSGFLPLPPPGLLAPLVGTVVVWPYGLGPYCG